VWVRERKKRFTASKCYSLYTPKNPLEDEEFWQRKLKGMLNSSFTGNYNTDRGLEDEPYSRSRYEVVSGFPVKVVGLMVHPDMPWLGCSPDGIIGDSVLFETKSPESGVLNSACDIVRNVSYVQIAKNGDMRLSSRHPYYGQIQLNMAITGLQSCDFVIYASSDDSIVIIRVPFDKVFAEDLIKKLTKVYFKHYLRIVREAQV